MQIDSNLILGEFAPTGTIRAAVNLANSTLVSIDHQTGDLSGLSVDVARKLAHQLKCPLCFVRYGSAAEILAAAGRGEWDIAFIASDPSRVDFSFSSPYTMLTATFLVAATSSFRNATSVDRKGCRIATARGAAYSKQLERTIRHATICPADGPIAALEMLAAGECDAVAGLRDSFVRFSEGNPSFRVVDGAFSQIPQTIAMWGEMSKSAAILLARIVRDH